MFQKCISQITSVALLGGILATSAFGATPSIGSFSSAPLKSLKMDVQVTEEHRAELEKIGGDFANAYRFHHLTFSYVQPEKLHYETVVLGTHIAYTINGNQKFTSIPSYHIHQVEDIHGSPGKKQTLLDIGLLPPEMLTEYNSHYLGKDGKLYKFEISPKFREDSSKEQIWFDPITHITVRRLHFNRNGKLEKSFVYANPVKVAGVYIPTRIEVYNGENQLAAVTIYKNVQVNTPIDQSIFDF